MSEYDNVVGGKLKLKGKALDVKACGIKKKKKRDKRYRNFSQTSSDIFGGNMSMDHHEDSRESVSFDDHLTPAERRFLHQTQKLELQRLAKMANKSHRDRIHEFNQYLANLTEHYDIPKVGPVALLLALGTSIQGLDVLQALNNPKYEQFNKALTEANLVDKINALKSVTVLPLSNKAMASLAGKSPAFLKATVSTHVLIGYYDQRRIFDDVGSQIPIETLFQSSGLAKDKQGYVLVQQVNEGELVMGSAASPPGTVFTSALVQTVANNPEEFVAIELNEPILVPGIENLFSDVKVPLGAGEKAASPSALAPGQSSDASRLCMGLLGAASASAAFILGLLMRKTSIEKMLKLSGLRIFYILALLLALGTSIQGLDVLQALNNPKYEQFNKALTEANLVDKINALKSVTVLPLSNKAMASLAGKSPAFLKATVSTHVLIGYYDQRRIFDDVGSQIPIETLFQSSGLAKDKQGYVLVQQVNEGELVMGSAASPPGTVFTSALVQTVANNPEEFVAIELNEPILVPGIENLFSDVKVPLGAGEKAASPSALAPGQSSDASRLCMGLLGAASASAAFILGL
ncbi:protein FAM32A [Vigna unguiculata]|uniref:Protein FAM32A n=1 Tax=Vigna unguiculata TaxID=3917 RepID=A0A4D6NQQ6_VIGUN|nr:protein FAM32A [Vigna unguiculata]